MQWGGGGGGRGVRRGYERQARRGGMQGGVGGGIKTGDDGWRRGWFLRIQGCGGMIGLFPLRFTKACHSLHRVQKLAPGLEQFWGNSLTIPPSYLCHSESTANPWERGMAVRWGRRPSSRAPRRGRPSRSGAGAPPRPTPCTPHSRSRPTAPQPGGGVGDDSWIHGVMHWHSGKL